MMACTCQNALHQHSTRGLQIVSVLTLTVFLILPQSWGLQASNKTDLKRKANPVFPVNLMPPFSTAHQNLTIFELFLLNKLEDQLSRMVFPNIRNPLSTDLTISSLYNWLVATGWNVDQAEKLFIKSMRWREKNQVDRLANEPVPEDMLNHFYFNVGGQDKEGCPLLTMPLGDWRTPRSFLEKTKSALVSGDKLKNHFIQMLESVLKFQKAYPTPCSQFVLICDLEGFTSLHSAGAHSFRWFADTLEQNYPNTLKLAYFINSSPSFIKMLELLKPTLGRRFGNKVYVYTERVYWEPAILQNIDADQLPPKYGGQHISIP